MSNETDKPKLSKRFRNYLPVVIDVETGGLNSKTDALLEVAAVTLEMNDEGKLARNETHFSHIQPFPSANLDPAALEINKIDPHHPFRFAIPENEGLEQLFQFVKEALKKQNCQRAILVGHNPSFDLSFIQAACKRCEIKKTPFHKFTTFDTATLGALAFGQTVLARALKAAKIPFNPNEAHSAIYDAEKTADLFCLIVNQYKSLF